MRTSKTVFFLFRFLCLAFHTQAQNFKADTISIGKFTEGNIVSPTFTKAKTLLIFIQGSGPTNRDGNSAKGMGNTSDFARKIAYQIGEKGIASFRFDKRIFKTHSLGIAQQDLRFEDLVTDVSEILQYFKKEGKYRNYIIAGHSQGSLIGMLAAQDHADAFISLSGPGEPIESILIAQLSAQLPELEGALVESFKELKENGQTKKYPYIFAPVFHPNFQAFLASWMKYDPSEEIAKLQIPVLIINGTRDLQIKEAQAKMLHKAAPNSKLVLLKDMNHIFREIKEEEKDQNLASYNKPEEPLHPQLISILTDFIKNLEKH